MGTNYKITHNTLLCHTSELLFEAELYSYKHVALIPYDSFIWLKMRVPFMNSETGVPFTILTNFKCNWSVQWFTRTNHVLWNSGLIENVRTSYEIIFGTFLKTFSCLLHGNVLYSVVQVVSTSYEFSVWLRTGVQFTIFPEFQMELWRTMVYTGQQCHIKFQFDRKYD